VENRRFLMTSRVESAAIVTPGRIEILDHPVQRPRTRLSRTAPSAGNKTTVDHPTSAGSHDDYANALALAAVASRERRGMLDGYSVTSPLTGSEDLPLEYRRLPHLRNRPPHHPAAVRLLPTRS
jgi:hypothetical protein